MIASVSTSSKIIVEKSTVPVKTAEAIDKAKLSFANFLEQPYFLSDVETLLKKFGLDFQATSPRKDDDVSRLRSLLQVQCRETSGAISLR